MLNNSILLNSETIGKPGVATPSSLLGPDHFRSALRQIPAAVAIISSAHQGQRRGLTATAVCSVSASPPQLLVCVNRQTLAHDVIRAAGRFGVNYLSSAQTAIAQAFAAPTNDPEARFATGEWIASSAGTPLLAQALASFDCQLTQAIDSGTHTIYIGEISDLSFRDAPSLLYKCGAYGAA